MNAKYGFLEKFIYSREHPPADASKTSFFKLDNLTQDVYIKRLGSLPVELLAFYREVGSGIISQSISGQPEDCRMFLCMFLSPERIWKTSVNFDEEEGYSRFNLKKCLPFYEMNRGRYMHFKKDGKGNFLPGIYHPSGRQVSDSFYEFVHRCFYESATFWLSR
jgi:hypothetical protein